jgi:Transposase DDE domain
MRRAGGRAVQGYNVQIVASPEQPILAADVSQLSPRQGDEARRIEAVLATPEGKALYRRRQQLVEPVFANTKVIRRADRFLRRGLVACQAQGRLIAATHNLSKLWRAGLATARTPSPEPLVA